MPLLILDAAAFMEKLADLPLVKCHAGENVLTAGSTTGRLTVLKSGTVEVVKDGVQIAKISAPGSVFGELAVLLGQPHTADVRALEQSEFHVALYVAATLAQRLDSANRALVEIKRQLRAGEPRIEIGRTVEKVQELLSSVSLVYAGYPSDPYEAGRLQA